MIRLDDYCLTMHAADKEAQVLWISFVLSQAFFSNKRVKCS